MILRQRQVLDMCGIGKTKLWEMVVAREFPAPIRLGGEGSRAVGWHKAEVEEWIATRPRVTGDRPAA